MITCVIVSAVVGLASGFLGARLFLYLFLRDLALLSKKERDERHQ